MLRVNRSGVSSSSLLPHQRGLNVSRELAGRIMTVEATDPMTATPVRKMPLPAQTVEESVADTHIGDVSDDRIDVLCLCDLIEHMAGTDKRSVAGAVSTANIVECEETVHAPREMKVKQTDVALKGSTFRFPPNLSDRYRASKKV